MGCNATRTASSACPTAPRRPSVLDAYRRLSKLHHPDQGGTPERFVEIQRAYETCARGRRRTAVEERLAALDQEVREAAARKPGRDARADAVVRDVNDLVEGLDGLSSKLDGL